MAMTTSIAPFSGRPLPPLDWKRMVGLVTLAPLRILLLIPLLALLWLTSRIGSHCSTSTSTSDFDKF